MPKLRIINHSKGAPGLRLLGIGPNFLPCNGLSKLRKFLNENTFWAQNRKLQELKICLAKSDVVVSIWEDYEIVGFGRALTDGLFRGVLWDIVIHKDLQGKGYGKLIVSSLLNSKELKKTKKIYLMTTNQQDFYSKFGFTAVSSQKLLLKEIKS
tara:strand:+ start:435 stop:896 length:462 start_codon:yes stop_codon:yes gene_type:complete